MERVENRMVVDWQWTEMPQEVKVKLNSEGYREIGTGIFVPKEDAFHYALEHCIETTMFGTNVQEIQWNQEFKEMLVEWFYSGHWIKEA